MALYGRCFLLAFLCLPCLAQNQVELERLPCYLESSLRSIQGSSSTSIQFINRIAAPVSIYWINYAAQRVLYRSNLGPGQSYQQLTWLTHPWIVINESNGLCSGIWFPRLTAGKVTVEDATLAPEVAVSPESLIFNLPVGGEDQSQLLLAPEGVPAGETFSFSIPSSAAWLSGPPASYQFQGGAFSVGVSVSAAGLATGVYSSRVEIRRGQALFATVPVILTVQSGPRMILVPQAIAFDAFRETCGGGQTTVVAPEEDIWIIGSGTFTWNVSAPDSSYSLTAPRLRISPTQGQLFTPPLTTVRVDVAGLPTGAYYGRFDISSPAASPTPQTVPVVLHINEPGPATAAELIFAPSQPVYTNSVDAATFTLNVRNRFMAPQLGFRITVDHKGGPPWLSVTPTTGTADGCSAPQVRGTVDPRGLSNGIYHAVLNVELIQGTASSTLSFGRSLVVHRPSPGLATKSPRPAADGCTVTKIAPVIVKPDPGFRALAGIPQSLVVEVIDDCAEPVSGAAAQVSFSNGDHPVRLFAAGPGRYRGAWTPRRLPESQVVATAAAIVPGSIFSATSTVVGTVSAAPGTPLISEGGILNAASYERDAPIAPGEYIAIFGSELADATVEATSLPLPKELGGVSVELVGKTLPLRFVSAGQINAVVPFDVPARSAASLVVDRDRRLTSPEPVQVADAVPGIFTLDGTGQGQGHIYKLNPDGSYTLADRNSPAASGDVLLLYASGLGGVDQTVDAAAAAPLAPLSRATNSVTVTIGGKPAPLHFAGLAPGFVSLFQINASVPAGVEPGPSVPLLIQVGDRVGPAVTLAVR